MKVLVGHFSSESNEHSRSLMTYDKFVFRYGEDFVNNLKVRDIFEEEGIELIPSIGAYGHPHGPVTKDAFDYILSRILYKVKEHIHEIDGIYLFLHGASKVIDLEGGSAEHAIMREIRKVVGPHLPIAVVMDPHGNITKEIVDNANIMRCYRESPHTDAEETRRIVAKLFVDLLKRKRGIKPAFRKVPIIMGGERSVSSDEPMASINRLLDEVEKDIRIMSTCYYVGYLRHDGDKLGAAVVVVPSEPEHADYADEMAQKIADYAFSKRHEFHFHGHYGEPEEALKQAVEFDGRPVFITDSGDNTGAGADGFNNYIMQQILALENKNGKQYLISGVIDTNAYKYLYDKEVGAEVSFSLGMNYDEYCKAIPIEGTVVARGIIAERYLNRPDIGTAITVKMKDAPVSVVVEFSAVAYTDLEQFKLSNIDLDQYDVIVVKQGYISDDFKKCSPFTVMSLTKGPTYQRSELYDFKRIMRPMFPYDDI